MPRASTLLCQLRIADDKEVICHIMQRPIAGRLMMDPGGLRDQMSATIA